MQTDPILTIIVGRWHDFARPTDQVAPGTGKQVADFAAGTQTGTRRNCRHGKQDRTDRLGRFDPQRTLYTAHCLKGERTTS